MSTAVFDGHYLLHRVMHVPQLRVLQTTTGKSTGGVFGVLKSLRSTLYSINDIRRVIVVFDGGHSERRKRLFPEYKNRPKNVEVDPDGISYVDKFVMQLRYLHFILPRIGVKVVELRGREADDVVGLIARKLHDKGEELSIIVSDDKDMFQLISDRVHLWRPIAEERVDLTNFAEITGCKYEHFLLRKAILGDPSDHIPGVHGVGAKTIDGLLQDCPDIGDYPFENFFEAAFVADSARTRAIVDAMQQVLMNYELIDIAREQFTELEAARAIDLSIAKSDFDIHAVRRIFLGFEFLSLVADFSSWVVPFQLLR